MNLLNDVGLSPRKMTIKVCLASLLFSFSGFSLLIAILIYLWKSNEDDNDDDTDCCFHLYMVGRALAFYFGFCDKACSFFFYEVHN